MLLPLLMIAAQANATASPACLVDGTGDAKLVGMIGVSTARGDPSHGKPAYRFVTLTLDAPTCLRIPATGKMMRVRVVELIGEPPNETLPFRFKGRHAIVTGRELVHAPTDAPEKVLLYAPKIAGDED